MFLEFLCMIEVVTLYKSVSESFFGKVCVLIFAPQNIVRSMFLEFFR